jgi:uncharacterized protein
MTERAALAVLPTGSAIARLRPIDVGGTTLTGGFWAERQRLNRDRTLPHGFEELGRAGNLANLRLAGGATGRYTSLGQAVGLNFPFLDSDVYKWLEAAGWEIGNRPDAHLATAADEAIAAIAAAQRPDGYVNSFVQVVAPGSQYKDLAWGHELYCLGHLIQAGIAWHRAVGDDRLLDIAIRAADSAEREFGPSGRPGIEGHPQVEMALVELFRTTAERRFLDLAAAMIDGRGHGLLGDGRFGRAYWQDHLPLRDAQSVAGHAVRQLYLDCGAVDVATELGDEALLGAVHERWRDMIARHAYLTGGLGSRHNDESFGDPYELPPDRAYAETCAAIASVMLAWRLLLATGDPACADVIERTIYNGVLPGVSLDGTSFFYENPLQRRTDRAPAENGQGQRSAWYPCACCPPNLMRLVSSWQQYAATSDPGGIQLHQYATGEVGAETAGGTVRLRTETDYPWAGQVTVTVLETPDSPWALSLRIPAWCQSGCVRDGTGEERVAAGGRPWSSGGRTWRPGDTILLELDMPARVTRPHPRIDAIRGCLALERGPLVYCIETADLPAGLVLEDVGLDPAAQPTEAPRPDIGPTAVGLTVPAVGTGPELLAIPYFAWANRTVEAMRVWIPSGEARTASEEAAKGGI